MKTYNRTLAQTIDLINEYVIRFYNDEIDEDPNPVNMQGEFTKRYGIDHTVFESAMRIMKEEGYIEYVVDKDTFGTIKELKHTPKGMLLYFNGGMLKQIKREEVKNNLYKIGQISLVIAALYYLLEIIKTFNSFFCQCL